MSNTVITSGLSFANRIGSELAELESGEQLRYLQDHHGDTVAASTSFGAQSAVLLHLLHTHAPKIPVITIDTGFLFPETYRYAAQLMHRWPLDYRFYHPEYSAARLQALYGKIWEQGKGGLDKYNLITKVEPMNRALRELGATIWVSGIRRSQSSTRENRSAVEQQKNTLKVYPLLPWTNKQVTDYYTTNDLPQHPLVHKGYASIGDTHSTKPLESGMNPEDTRFGGAQRECGLHIPSDAADFQI